MMTTILIDIDNTLIETWKNQTTSASRALLQELRGLGDVKIVGFTSRPRVMKFATKWQLKKLGVKLDGLIMGKPRGRVYIGNRAVNFDCRTSDVGMAMKEVRRLLDG